MVSGFTIGIVICTVSLAVAVALWRLSLSTHARSAEADRCNRD